MCTASASQGSPPCVWQGSGLGHEQTHAHSHKYLLGKNKLQRAEKHRDLLVSQWMPDTPVCLNTTTRVANAFQHLRKWRLRNDVRAPHAVVPFISALRAHKKNITNKMADLTGKSEKPLKKLISPMLRDVTTTKLRFILRPFVCPLKV